MRKERIQEREKKGRNESRRCEEEWKIPLEGAFGEFGKFGCFQIGENPSRSSPRGVGDVAVIYPWQVCVWCVKSAPGEELLDMSQPVRGTGSPQSFLDWLRSELAFPGFSQMATYKISVATGDMILAGTYSTISITLVGERAESGKQRLDKLGKDFVPGAVSNLDRERAGRGG